jgi:hypothetical protein
VKKKTKKRKIMQRQENKNCGLQGHYRHGAKKEKKEMT